MQTDQSYVVGLMCMQPWGRKHEWNKLFEPWLEPTPRIELQKLLPVTQGIPKRELPNFPLSNDIACSEVALISNFQLQMYAFYNDFSAHLAMGLCCKRCISETAESICPCDTPLESVLNSLIGGKFISRKGVINTRRARLTAIAGLLVIIYLIAVGLCYYYCYYYCFYCYYYYYFYYFLPSVP